MKRGNSLSAAPTTHRQSESLRRTLAGWIGIGMLCVVIVIGVPGLYFTYQMEMADWKNRLSGESHEKSESISVLLKGIQDRLVLLGRLEPDYVQSRPDSVQSFLDQDPRLLEIVVLDASGIVSASAFEGKPLLANLPTISQSNWFRNAAAGQSVLEAAEFASADKPYLIVSVPSSHRGVIVGRLGIDVLGEAVRPLDLGPTGGAMLVTRDGRTLARTDSQVVSKDGNENEQIDAAQFAPAIGKSWVGSLRNLAGREVMAATAPVSGTDWTLLVQVPDTQLFAASRNGLVAVAGALLAITILSGLFYSRLLIPLVVRPIESLRTGVERIGMGDLSYRTEVGRRDELGVVAEALNQMTDRLRERDEQILDRTRALRASQARYRAIVEDQTELVCRSNRDGILTFVNQAYCRYFGKTREELIGHSFMPLIPDEDRSDVQGYFASLSQSSPVVTFEHRARMPDGSVRWQQWTARALFDAQGNVVEYASVGRDITERKRAQEALARRERYLGALAHVQRLLLVDDGSGNLYDQVFPILGRVSDASRVYAFENQRDSTGRLLTSLCAEWIAEGVPPERANPVPSNLAYEDCFPHWKEVLARGEIVDEFVAQAPDVERSFLESRGILSILLLPLMVDGEFYGFMEFDQCAAARPWEKAEVDLLTAIGGAMAQAIQRRQVQLALWRLNQESEQRVVERTRELRQSEERFRTIMESAKDAMVVSDESGLIILWNRAAEAMFGYPAAQALGQPMSLIVPERLRDRMQSALLQDDSPEQAALPRTFETIGLKENGEELPVEISVARWRSDREWFASAIIRDITDRKRAEQSLARSERYFRSLIENAFDVTAIEDRNGVFTYISPSVERVVGYKPSEVIGQPMLSFIHPDDWDKVQALFALNTNDEQAPVTPPQVRARHKDGTWRVMEAVAMNCLEDPAIAGIVTNIRDVTERTQAEERLQRSERRFRALVENSWDFVALLDILGTIRYISPSATAVSGYQPEELIGRNAFRFMPDEEVSFVRGVFESLVEQPGEAVTLTIRLLHRDGSYRWADLMAKNMLLEPAVQAIVVNMHDITDRKLAELRAQKRDAHLNALGQMGLAVTMSLDLDVVLNQIVRELKPLLEGTEGVSILLCEGNELVFAAVEGSGADTLKGVRMPADVGVAGAVVQTGQPQRISSGVEEAKIYRDLEDITGYHTQSLLAMPLKLASETIGVLEAVHRDPAAFGDEDFYLLQAAAKWASIAIGNARIYQDLERRLEEGEALSLIGQALSETLDLEKVLQLITTSAQQIIPGVTKAIIHLYDEKRKALYPAAIAGPVKTDQRTLTMRLGEGIAGRVMEQAAPINVGNIQNDPRYLLSGEQKALGSLLVAPIQSRQQRYGTISIESAVPNAFSPEDEALLTRLGTLANIAIKNAGLYHAEREQRALAEALRETATALGSTLEFDAVLDNILDNVECVVKYDLAAIMLIEQPSGIVTVARCQSADPALEATVWDFRMPVSQVPNLQRMLETGNSEVIPNVREYPDWVDLPATRWIASHLGVPIRLHDEVIGFLNLESTTPGYYAEEQIPRLQSFAAQAATALGNAKLYKELQDALRQEQTTRSQLIQTGKLAALGRMAASVAHEFNNPLQTIKNCLYLLQPEYLTGDAEFMHIAISETERLSRLVEQLRSAYRPEFPEDMRPLQLRLVLEQTCALIMPHLKENSVGYEFTLPPSEIIVTGVADQLKQVFLNIALNAVDAMKPRGGKITITSRVDPLTQSVAVAIGDTGRGIPEEDLPHLFDPFFTTKETGMGLGLAITFDIVQKHHGQIEVTSTSEQGSVFTVWLPLTD